MLRQSKALAVALLLCAAAYAFDLALGLRAAATTSGNLSGAAVRAPVRIVRDARGVPHIRASSEHDMYYAEGFVQASDRLAQMDLLRRFVYGRLAEIVGPVQLPSDVAMRYLDARDIVTREWSHLSRRDRATLEAFSDGVNAAIASQPLPFEFRVLLYQPEPWRPQDSLAVTIGIASTLDDPIANIFARNALWRETSHESFAAALPLSDPVYDVAVDGSASRSTFGPRSAVAAKPVRLAQNGRGSNAWAAGGARTATGRALLANDPHLDVSIPGVWYVVEMRSPNMHVAGATVPGVPGVILGHNERLAWAVTNGMATSFSVFRAGKLDRRYYRSERFRIRFGRDVIKTYYRAAHEFGVPDESGDGVALARWGLYGDARSPLATILQLDRATTLFGALHAIAAYPGSAQNFLIADAHGRVAYHLAGAIPNDPAWARYVHPRTELRQRFADLPFVRLPAVHPSRDAIVISANNKMYGPHYAYRLSPMFAPPFRAYRIAQLLHARRRYDVAYFAHMQMDVVSPAEAAFGRRLARLAGNRSDAIDRRTLTALRTWNGAYVPGSMAATVAHALRTEMESPLASPYAPFTAMRAATAANEAVPFGAFPQVPRPWREAGAVPLLHPFGAAGFPFLNGGVLAGDGDEYTIHVQSANLAQSFRAVWDVGNWDAGGLSLPAGNSGEIGSTHYRDQMPAWITGTLQPLPFSDTAVNDATRETLILRP